MITVLYLDGDSHRRTHIRNGLTSMDFTVRAVTRSSEAKQVIAFRSYDCVLAHCVRKEYADLATLCLWVRSSVRLIMILMNTADISLEGRLFDCGVDDVVVGAQACPHLIAKRIRARLRASKRRSPPASKVRLGHVVADFDRRIVQRGGIEHELPGILADLLYYFVCNADHVISRRELNESAIWAESICTPAVEGGKTFDVHVSRLRRIIEGDSHKPALIKSVRGVGWKLAVEPVRVGSERSAREPTQVSG